MLIAATIGWRFVSLLGLGVMVGLAWLMSTERRAVRWRPVAWGIGLQLAFGALVLSPALQDVFFVGVDGAVRRLLSFSEAGADFVFQTVEPHRVEVLGPDGPSTMTFAGHISPPLKTFAFWILPTIIFFSSLMSILYHLGLMQRIVEAIAWLMQKTMRTSGAESLAAAANIFVGQTEAPLVVRPYIAGMTASELNAVMTGGFATVAGGVMAAYVGFLSDIPGIAGHLVTASILSAPAALAIAKIMVPETDKPSTTGHIKLSREKQYANVMEAAAQGATDGMKLALNVAAMLIAFVGIIAMIDWFLGLVPLSFCVDGSIWGARPEGCEALNLSRILGWIFAPISLAMGVPWGEATVVGRLLGEKLVLTEFIAYIDLGEIMANPATALSHRSAIIASYALCGFANFASIGIQLGGIGGIAPERMGDLAAVALRAMIGGSLAAFMTATVAGAFLS
jgi:CNT family concentrative nucleoside transporter